MAAAVGEGTGIRLELERRAWIRLGRDVVGQATDVVVARSRAGPPGRRATLRILYADGGDRDACLRLEPLLREGSPAEVVPIRATRVGTKSGDGRAISAGRATDSAAPIHAPVPVPGTTHATPPLLPTASPPRPRPAAPGGTDGLDRARREPGAAGPASDRREGSGSWPVGPIVLGGQPWIAGTVLDADAAARHLGVRRGIPLGSAHRLAPEATFLDPEPEADRAAIEAAFEMLATFSPAIAGSADPADQAFGLLEAQIDGLELLWGPEPVLVERIGDGARADARRAAAQRDRRDALRGDGRRRGRGTRGRSSPCRRTGRPNSWLPCRRHC